MSNLSIQSFSSCEIVDSEYGLLKPKSPDLSTKSEVVCTFSFKEPTAGTSFVLTGIILLNCERFSINILSISNKHDIALHLNPRLPQNYIVRNSKISGHWQQEEVNSQFSALYDLFRGHRFLIEILINETEFLISVNGRHFAAFAHRIPYKKINAIEVKGDVKEVAIEQLVRDHYPDVPVSNISTEPPQTDLKLGVPYIVNIPCGFTRNKSIHIVGRVKMLPHSITINLQHKPYVWPHPIILLHINPRFHGGHHVICRNSWTNGRWQKEERTDVSSAVLCPGKTFKMVIECDYESYKIYLNEQLFGEFNFRCEPSLGDTLNIYGDLVLKKVWIEEKKFD